MKLNGPGPKVLKCNNLLCEVGLLSAYAFCQGFMRVYRVSHGN